VNLVQRHRLAPPGYVVFACSILPDHVHMVVARHERLAERIIGHLKARTTQNLLEEKLLPFVDFRDEEGRVPPVWVHRGWKVFLDSIEEIQRAIRYVEGNPVKEGMKKQKWKFVAPFDPKTFSTLAASGGAKR
jgi:REP element-mobilizing transposase RayT